MQKSDFYFDLPKELIAQEPCEPRDAARLLCLGRASGELFTLQQGQLRASNTDNLWLSEGFAERDGWLVRDERISWHDWLKRQNA